MKICERERERERERDKERERAHPSVPNLLCGFVLLFFA